jgi:WD40 repeat protein
MSDTEDEQIYYLSFNQDLSCISCGTSKGFIIYDTDPVTIRFQQNFGAGVGIVKMMYRYNIAALVGGGKHPLAPPNKCLIWDDQKKKIISELEYVNCVTAIEMTRNTFVVATDDTIRVYNFENVLQEICKFKTGPNSMGLCELSLNDQRPLVLCKTKKKGQVALLDYRDQAFKNKSKWTVDCHNNDIHKIRLNSEGTKFATSSEVGTLVRIFDTETLNQIGEFRRGSDQAKIQNIYFSDDSKFLLLTSDKSTLHIYSLCDQYSNTKSKAKFISGVLPSYFSSEWSLAKVTIPSENYIAGIVKSKSHPDSYDVNVFMFNGQYMHYVFYPSKNQLKLEGEGKYYEFAKIPTPPTPPVVTPVVTI